MKRARYDGPHQAVDVPLPDGTVETVPQGGQLKADVPAEFRDSLLKQADWGEVNQPGSKRDEEE